MAVNYLDILGEYYPATQATSKGNPEVYGDIVWVTSAIAQAELDAVYLVDYKTQKIIYFSELAREDIVNGFDSSALGYPHLYASEADDQLNLTGSVASQMDMYYACYAHVNGKQEIDLGGAKVGTDATGLANDTTTYNAEIVVDGTSSYVSIEGQNAQTLDALITQLNADVDFSALGSISLADGNLLVESATYNSSSSVNIIDAGLFSALTSYVAINAATPGADASEATKDYKFHTHAQLLTVMQDGANVKLTVLQKFNVKKAQILAAADTTAVDAITW